MASRYTIEQQANRLPSELRQAYLNTTLDRIQIDGNEFSGYFEYSFIEEKTYEESPSRSLGGVIDNLNSYAVNFVPHITIHYNYMGIDDYRRMVTLLNSKNEFTVTLYDIVANKRVTHKMYFATPSMPKTYQRYLQMEGILDYAVELIGTNNEIIEYDIVFDFNFPTGYSSATTSATVSVARNSTIVVGNELETKTITVGGTTYTLQYWEDQATKLKYIDGEEYFFLDDKTLKAIWAKQ